MISRCRCARWIARVEQRNDLPPSTGMGAMMKSAEEWAAGADFLDLCEFSEHSGQREVVSGMGAAKLADLIRAIQSDAIRAAAAKVICGCKPEARATCDQPGCGYDYYREILSLLPKDS